MKSYKPYRACIAWQLLRLTVVALTACLLYGQAFAREEPPQNMPQEERLQWFEAQCTKLTAEVKDLESRRLEYTELDAAGKLLSDRILLDGKPMHKRLKALEDERNQNPGDRERNEAYNKLYNQYTSRMTELISKDIELMWRDISNFAELNRRFEAAKTAWLPVESRYPLAKADREWACEETDRVRQAIFPDTTNVAHGIVVGHVRIVDGVVEILPGGRGGVWKRLLGGEPLTTGDLIRVQRGGLAELRFTNQEVTEYATEPEDICILGSESEVAINQLVTALTTYKPGLFVRLYQGTLRVLHALARGEYKLGSIFSVRAGTSTCGMRGTDVVVEYDPKRDHAAYYLREGNVEISSGNQRRELKAGHMIAVDRGAIKPVKPLDQSKWKSLAASMEISKSDTPTVASPFSAFAPSTAGRGMDMTRRDLPSGPQAMGGETRYDGQTFFVQSAPSYNTMTEIGTEALMDFHAETEVSLIGGGQEVAGLYLSANGDPKGRPGDIFFGVHSSGLVLQYEDQGSWRDLPREARGPAKNVRLEIERRNGRYHFLWNGAKVGEYDGALESKRVALYAGEGVRAEFRQFLVTK